MVLELLFDESGNLGSDGRFFVIGCVEIESAKKKPLINLMKRLTLDAKKQLKLQSKTEIKGSLLSSRNNKRRRLLLSGILEKAIVNRKVNIHYAVIDLENLKNESLLQKSDDKNAFYNYMIKLLVKKILKNRSDVGELRLVLDNRTIKIGSRKSLRDYLISELVFDVYDSTGENKKIEISVSYVDSSQNYLVQIADLVAHSIYKKYESSDDEFYNIINSNIIEKVEFPRKK